MQDRHNKTVTTKEIIVSELTEKEKRTVEKFHRQLSTHSVLSIRSEDPWRSDDEEDDDDEISEEEALRLQRVLQAFQNHKRIQEIPSLDYTDGKYRRLSSNQSAELFLSGITSESRYVSPGRFHVILNEKSKDLVREVHQMIEHFSTIRRAASREVLVVQNEPLNSSYHALNHGSHSNATADYNGYKTDVNHEGKSKTNQHMNGSGHLAITNPTSGQSNWYTVPLSLLPPKERFKYVVRRVIQSERRRKKAEREQKRKDYFEKLWKRRGNVTWFDLLLTLIGPIAFIADSATDLKVASDHFSTGHPWWGFFTLMLVIFPALIMNIVSYFFYEEDESEAQRKPESGWKTVKITHLFQMGLLERYWQIMVKSYRIKRKQIDDFRQYQLLIAMNLDTAMLQMILAFTEDAPQLVLQLYVLVRRKLVEKLLITSLQDIWTIASITFSFISYSRALVNYIKCLRDSKDNKGQLRWYGYVAMWLWRAFMFISRVLVLVSFATEFHVWFFVVVAVHFFIVLVLTWSHKVNFFSEQPGLQTLLRFVIAYIHTFCYFVLDGTQTVQWAKWYYILVAIEAVLFSTLWFTNSTHYVSLKFELAVMFLIFLSFVMGLLMMITYYKFLHPKFKRPQTKWYSKTIPKEELAENVQNEEEGDEVQHDDDHFNAGTTSSMMKQVPVWV